MGTLRAALAQINPTVGDFEGNVAKIKSYIEKARAAGAALVVFPEMAVCGYPPEDLLLRPRFLGDAAAALDEVIAACTGITSVVGFVEAKEGAVYNAAAIIRDGALVGTYRKMELPNYGVFDEKRYFTSGRECFVAESAAGSFAVTICEDVWVAGGAAEKRVREEGIPLVINLSASPFHAGKLDERTKVLAGFADRAGAVVCYANLAGGQDELVFDGGSLVVSPDGRIAGRAAAFGEDLLVADLDLADRDASGTRIEEESDGLEEIRRALVTGTRDYVEKNGFGGVVIGLSGGIDSALTAAVAVEALGAERVTGVTMPSRYSSEETRGDAARLAENLGIRLLTIPIEGFYTAFLDGLAESIDSEDPGVTGENLQARIRGNILMALSNRYGCLVLTTGNKSELAVGYCTLYGDMAGGFAVIKDVPKTTVFELSRHINADAGREIIPQRTIDRPPTAELKDNQKDEDSLPPYDVLDPVIQGYVEEDLAPDEIAARGFDHDLVMEIVRMIDRSEYKRRQAPPGVKITPKAFGRDRRLPITNRYVPGAFKKTPPA